MRKMIGWGAAVVVMVGMGVVLGGKVAARGQAGEGQPQVVRAVRQDTLPALHDLPPQKGEQAGGKAMGASDGPEARVWQTWGEAEAVGPDPVWQAEFGLQGMPGPELNFPGLDNYANVAVHGYGVSPPDTNGDIGKDHYVQFLNIVFGIWEINRSQGTATLVYGPAAGRTLWSGLGGACETHDDGDPIVLYDALAERWLMSQMAWDFDLSEYHECVAISQTSDPTGGWNRYDFLISYTKLNDYPKLAVWPDAYYLTFNQFEGGQWAGQGVAALEREQMLAGGAARMVYYDLYTTYPNLGGMLPADMDGATLPPAGAPGYFVQMDDDAWGYGPDQLQVWQFHVDWATPTASTFTPLKVFNLTALGQGFDSRLCQALRGRCIDQPGTDIRLESLSDRLMHRLAYRNFGDHAALTVNHTVDANGLGLAGIRWYEIHLTSGDANLADLGTYAPDGEHRWMGSVALDQVGNLALGYSVSSKILYPAIRYTGRLVGDPAGLLPQGEVTLKAGGGAQTSLAPRWGDYSMMGIDPVDDCTFWYTQEYLPQTSFSVWATQVGTFKFPTCTSGPQGMLSGRVTELGSGLPVAGAQIAVTGSVSNSVQTLTDADGYYQIIGLPTGAYTASAAAYGYLGATAGVVISDGVTTGQDFSLERRPAVTVEGVVTDGSGHGWPLYAEVELSGGGLGEAAAVGRFTTAMSGTYTVTLYQGLTYQFEVRAVAPGYQPTQTILALETLSSTVRLDFSLLADQAACTAPGYQPAYLYFEDFEAGNGGFTITTTNVQLPITWAWGAPVNGPGFAHSGQAVWATNLNGDYANKEDSYLVSPVIDMSASAGQALVVTWWQWLSTERDYDFVSLEASADGGLTWQRIYGEVGGALNLNWAQRRALLDPVYATSQLRLRYRMRANYVNTAPGYYLDDLGIGAFALPTQTVYTEDFELSAGSYITSGTTTWAWGVPLSGPGTAHSGSRVWATNLTGNYMDNEDGLLTSPPIDLSAYQGQSPVLSWWQWLATESGYDFPTVEISRDGGSTWQPVYQEVSGDLALTWTRQRIVLDPAYAVNSFRVRFRLWADGAVNEAGWYLDDVAIEMLPVMPAAVCGQQAGGLVLGNVYAAQTGFPLDQIRVGHASGATVSFVTPDDPAVADGFYILFAPSGWQTITAAFHSASDTHNVLVVSDQIVWQDFYLPVFQCLLPLVVKSP